ncbi:DUF3622 domain-containing protein [Gilvimarinus chinensis]|uniref:DUF3622 domain-containing protein n=1 Tax=Gilvimarinus chinensis TaxID=396005 RepID=UPI00035C8A13|nr:DUF3622 domain-containing protein [Gilvimarinus chinensis]
MSKNKKFNVQVTDNGGNWRAEITRRASARKTVTSKVQDGFASEAEATQWAEAELKIILDNVRARQSAKQ